MRRIEEEEVRRVARLARLALSEEEVERLGRELGSILGHFEALREVEAADAAAGGGAAEATPLREDVEDPDALHRSPVDEAPDGRGDWFVVPRLPAMDERGAP